MKKSKFLKKSLAMLLALMLVVAMIPLSASAAAPVMRQVDVTAGGQVVQLVPGEGANTLEGEISNLSQNIRLTVLAGNGNTVYYTDMTSSATTDEVAVNNGDGTWTIDIAAADVADFVNSEGQVQVNFSVADSEKPATRISYTVLLTRVYVSTDTSITNFTINSNTQVQLGETVIQENDIYFTVPYDAAMIAQNSFTVRELELASASARVQFSRADGTNGENWTYYYSTEVTTEKVITDGLTTDTGVAVQIMNGDRLEITNNGRTHTYNIHITPASGFTSFTTEEGLDAVMFTDTGDIAVLLPWGYTDGKDSVTVTPVFALDYDRAWATTTSDAEVVSGESTLTISSDDVINGNTPSTTGNFHSFGDDGTPVDWETRKAEATSFNAFMHNVEYYGGAGNKGETYGYQLVVNYSEEASRTYDIYFFETRLNNDATITDLTIGSETAVIDQEAKTIDITVPMGTVLTALNNGTSHVAMTMEASNNATITMPMQQNAISITENDTTRAPYVDYTVSGVINGTNSVQISVTSEDGLTQNFYTLNVTVADEFVKPAITNMTLQSLDGTNYEGNITTAVDGMNVVQFELPYEIYDEALLNGWKLFYTKTVGSTITFDSNGQTPGGAVAMPRSGDELTGGEVYLPDIDDEVRADVAIDLHVSGEDLSAESTSYYIEITRAAGKEVSELTDFSLYGLPDYANLDSGLYDDLYGTEYTYLTPNYTVSEGAIVIIDDPELQGKPLFPGYTDVNFSTSRKMTVIAENESDSTEYTIRVQIEEQFSDVSPDDWFYDNVMDAAANGYVSGMGDGTFNPKGATTRAQFASMIAKAMGYDDSLAGETRFKDVPADQWYAGAITYCFDNDIISGYDDGTFQPDKTITRQEAASILKNAFNLTGNSGEKFPDDSAIAGWAKENVYAVKHSGLMKGDADTGNFRPTSTIIRAEAASILMNANRAGLIK